MNLQVNRHKDGLRIRNRFGKVYTCSDEVDMQVLCQEVNEQFTLMAYKINSLESKLEAVKRIVGDFE